MPFEAFPNAVSDRACFPPGTLWRDISAVIGSDAGGAMRSYDRNSPEAAARIIALVLIADGHVCQSELDALDRLDASRELGLAPGALPCILQTLCEDLLLDAYGGARSSRVDSGTLASLMAEVDEPALQRTVVRLAEGAANADRYLAEGESIVLEGMRRGWHLRAGG